MAVRGQTSIEFLLILSAVVLVILAGVMSLSEIMKMQRGAYSAIQGGVENASTGLIYYLSNETFGTGFLPISGGFGNFTNASLVSLQITKNEPYFINQPSIIKLTAWNNYPAPMVVPKILIRIVNSSGAEIPVSPSDEENVTIILSKTITSAFIPTSPGVYNVTAVAQDENGSVLINPLTEQPVVVKTNFTVLDSKPPASGFVKTFNIEKEVVQPLGESYIEYFQLPENAVVYSAVLEITDAHKYENKTAGAQASYHYSKISVCECAPDGTGCHDEGVFSSDFFSQGGVVEIPENSFITDANTIRNEITGEMTVFINGISNQPVFELVKPGLNTISISINPVQTDTCGPTHSKHYISTLADGTAVLTIWYYSPSPKTISPGELMSIQINAGSIHSPYAVEDVSGYVKGGENAIQFYNIQGTFKFKLVVTYA
ncbi:MAG: hypothetical protein QXF56_01045 [Candidatus Micrarchaeia archaeon]